MISGEEIIRCLNPEDPTLKIHPQLALALIEQEWQNGQKQQAFNLIGQFVKIYNHNDSALSARSYIKLADWQRYLEDSLNESNIQTILSNLKASTEYGKDWHKT